MISPLRLRTECFASAFRRSRKFSDMRTGTLIFSMMIFSMMIFSMMIFSMMIFSMMIFSMMIFSMMIFSMMIFSMMASILGALCPLMCGGMGLKQALGVSPSVYILQNVESLSG